MSPWDSMFVFTPPIELPGLPAHRSQPSFPLSACRSSSTATQLLVPAAVLLLGWFITKSFRTAYQAGEKPPPGMAESYQSLDHIFLNARKPQTEWLNMGWWEGEVSSANYCRETSHVLTEHLSPAPT